MKTENQGTGKRKLLPHKHISKISGLNKVNLEQKILKTNQWLICRQRIYLSDHVK